MMTTLRRIYTELPYAAALDENFIHDRCSNCFSEAHTHCPAMCGAVVYCNDACVKADRPSHEFECNAFISKQDKTTEAKDEPLEQFSPSPLVSIPHVSVRLLGRIIGRLRLDGGVSQVAEGLPKHVKSWTFSQLNPVRRSERKCYDTATVVELFFDFFDKTPLASKKRKEIRRLLLITLRNAVNINQQPHSRFPLFASGRAIYLNQPRFKHRCKPDLNVRLADSTKWRIAVEMVVRNDKDSENKLSTEKLFDQLSIDLNSTAECGVSKCLCVPRWFTNSLSYHFDFPCQCTKCKDPAAMNFQENASAVECGMCERPYVWASVKGSAKLTPSCGCAKGEKRMAGNQENLWLELEFLKINWTEVIFRCGSGELEPSRVILECEAVLPSAERYWHPTANTRLASLYYYTFLGYASIGRASAIERPNTFTGYQADFATSAIRMGESLLATLEYHHFGEQHEMEWMTLYVSMVYFCYIADDKPRLFRWLSKMKTTLDVNGDKKAAAAVQQVIFQASKKSSKEALLSALNNAKSLIFSKQELT